MSYVVEISWHDFEDKTRLKLTAASNAGGVYIHIHIQVIYNAHNVKQNG